jgi:uncharacterized protein
MTKYTSENSNFGANGPFFHLISEGLEGLVDREDYFDLLADDVVFEYVISVPGYPRRVRGRENIIDLYRGYDDYMKVHSADNLHVYRDLEASVVVLEYAVHGESPQTGRPYDNQVVSIITVKDHKVARWRDYLDPIAIFEATGWPDTVTSSASTKPFVAVVCPSRVQAPVPITMTDWGRERILAGRLA